MSRDTHSVDPDAQATVNDFMDYTEYLHADVIRSLKLLHKLDEQYNTTTQEIHDLLIQYNELQGDESDAQEAQELRAKISYKLDLTISRRGSSYAEATRLYDEVERQLKRINSVRMKLSALPLPPSRDPTPAASPANKANRVRGNAPSARISLKYDALKVSLPFSPMDIDPYEVMGSPMFSDNEQEWERMSSPVTPGASRKKGTFKSPKREKTPKPKLPKLPGHVGTNVHSAVAGISTSNALSLLTPPPDDVKPGSKWAPWFRLTEYEMALLRKKMKKNAIWSPSDTMIRRELSAGQRGTEYYPRARKLAHEQGTAFEDFDDTPNQHKRALHPGEIRADFVKMGIPRELPVATTTATPAAPTISIKKERKSTASKEPSKLSTPVPAISEVGRNFELIREGLNSKFKEASPSSSRPPASSRKRKLEAVDAPVAAEEPASSIKKVKTGGAKDVKGGKSTGNPPALQIPLIDMLAAEIPARTPSRKGSSTPILRQPEPAIVPDVTTLKISERARRKRAPVGQVTAPIEGGSAILVSKSRTRAPRKVLDTPASLQAEKTASESGKQSDREKATKIEEEQAGMDVDGEEEVGEDEERYCFCGDVSYGTMIACENDDCARSWFHLDCVGLKEPPGRREKWWCATCRKQLRMGTPAGGKKL